MPYSCHALATWWRMALLLAAGLLLTTRAARAQAPAWGGAAWGPVSIWALATDDAGNVFVTGSFYGTVQLGGTTLVSAGGTDLFVAKWAPATSTWVWAVRGGGLVNDFGNGIAVSGSRLYVTGSFTNTLDNSLTATLDGSSSSTPLRGASNTFDGDILLARWTDEGTSAQLNWAQVAGGAKGDIGWGVAVSGSNVYLTGHVINDALNAYQVTFGGNGTTPGTYLVSGIGASYNGDLVLAKYVDLGSSAIMGWVQVGGGAAADEGTGIAVRGSSVYVVGSMVNNSSNSQGGRFGGTPVPGATATLSNDWLLVKYEDDGSSSHFVWSQVAGGTSTDYALGVALGDAGSVYVVGNMRNNRRNDNAFVLGGNGSTVGTAVQYGASSTAASDLLLAKYTDNGPTATFGWSQVAGGTNYDDALGLAVSGPYIFVVGDVVNDPANSQQVTFGGSGTAAGTSSLAGLAAPDAMNQALDGVLARYTDQGATGRFDWAKLIGGPGNDGAMGVAVRGRQVYVAGGNAAAYSFGPATVPAGTNYLAYLADPALPLPTRAAGPGAALTLWPNPAPSGASSTLTGAAPGAAVRVLDALGRQVATTTVGNDGTAALGKLAPGLYLVQAGPVATRLAVD